MVVVVSDARLCKHTDAKFDLQADMWRCGCGRVARMEDADDYELTATSDLWMSGLRWIKAPTLDDHTDELH